MKVTDSDHGVILKKSCTEGVSDCDGNRDSDACKCLTGLAQHDMNFMRHQEQHD